MEGFVEPNEDAEPNDREATINIATAIGADLYGAAPGALVEEPPSRPIIASVNVIGRDNEKRPPLSPHHEFPSSCPLHRVPRNRADIAFSSSTTRRRWKTVPTAQRLLHYKQHTSA